MDMSTQGPIKTRREGAILEVTLDRPKANAIDLATSRIMGLTFRAFRDDDSLRVCILRAEGEKFFCPGWDLKAAADGDAVDGDYGVGGFGGLQELPNLNKPVIAAVNGAAAGAGANLALSADVVIATESAVFLQAFTRIGLMPDGVECGLLQSDMLRQVRVKFWRRSGVLAVLPKPVEPASLYAALTQALSPHLPA